MSSGQQSYYDELQAELLATRVKALIDQRPESVVDTLETVIGLLESFDSDETALTRRQFQVFDRIEQLVKSLLGGK